jgi:hypothetical protein
MSIRSRVILLSIFFLLFLTGSVFIVFNSLGYTFDVKTGTIKNNFTISVKTIPSQAKVALSGFDKTFETPFDISINDKTNTEVTISKENFATDTFSLNSPADKNSFINLEKIFLAPTKSEIIFSSTAQENSLLSGKYLLSYTNGVAYVKSIEQGGIKDSQETVSSIEKKLPTILNWKKLSENYFINADFLLYRTGSGWVLEKPTFLSNEYKQVLFTSNGNFLILRSSGVLELVKTSSKEIEGVAKNISFIYQDEFTKQIWVLDSEGIYRWDDDRFEYKKESRKIIDLTTISKLASLKDLNTFKVANFYSGKIVFLDNKLWFISDFDQQNPTLISDYVSVFTTSSVNYSTNLFWVNSQSGELYVQNFELNYRKILSTITNTQQIKLVYNERWKRMIVYQENMVSTFPFEINNNNQYITSYKLNPWLEKQTCLDNYEFDQFCLKGSEVVNYTNKVLF